MSLVLGIDTGGTYYRWGGCRPENRDILDKAKALTTREDLSIGIRNCINNLKFEKLRTSVLFLCQPHCTNAIVEGRGCEVGLLMLGHEPVGTLPVEHFSSSRRP